MRLGTVLKAFAALAAVMAVALVAVVKTIDVDEYGRRMAEAIAAETGRELQVRGEFSLQLSLTPTLVATDVALANLPGAMQADMLHVDRVEAEIGLLSLLRREISIRRLVLDKPDLLLERDAAGRGNWEFSRKTPETGRGGSEMPATTVVIGKVLLDEARVAYNDAQSRTAHTLLLERLSIEAASGGGPLSIDGRGTINQRKLDVSGVIGSLAELDTQTKPFPVKLKTTIAGTIVMVDGTISRIAGLNGLDLKVLVEANDVAEAAQLAGLVVPEMGPLRASARLIGSAAAPQLSEVEAALGRKDLVRVVAKGSIKAPLDLGGIDLTLSADAASPGTLLAKLGADTAGGQPLNATAQLTGDGEVLSLSMLKATAGQSDLIGAASLRLGGERPVISANLASTRLDLADLGVVPQTKPATPSQDEGPLFRDTPIDVSAVTGLDADLSWKADTLVAHGIAFEQVEFHIRAVDGVLTLKPAAAQLADGVLTAEGVLDARTSPAAVRVEMSARQVAVGGLLAAAGITQSLTGGQGDLAVRLAGKGASLHQVMASLEGETSLVIDRAVIDNSYVDLLAFDVMRQLTPWTPKEPSTTLNCLVARFAVAGGKATSRQLLFDSDHVTMGGEAVLDLGAETVRASLVPRPKQASLMNLATPMEVSGPIAAPTVAPNTLALAKSAAIGAAGAIVAAPLVLLPFVTRGSGDENPCVQALKQAKQPLEKAPAKPKQGFALPDIGGAITDLFGKKK